MQFQDYLMAQLNRHPSMQPQDIVKLCYQAAYGAEHLLQDINKAKDYFYSEYTSVSENELELYEEISPTVCRVNLSTWKASGMPADWLFHMFVNSASIPQGGPKLFLSYLETAEKLLPHLKLSFTLNEWNVYLQHYKESGMQSVHHSEMYRQQEHPAYRIVNKKFCRLIPILQKAAKLPSKECAKVIAIDGRSASGKSTMSELLKLILNAGVIHMDDFFLPANLRTKERLSEPGGNIHYERFETEVLPRLSNTSNFSYQVFDCGKMEYSNSRFVAQSEWRIVEGAYSCHPHFGDYADLTVFSDIQPEEQMKRIINRNGTELAEMFRTRWIPLEEEYYNYYQIKESSDIIISVK